MIPVALAIAWIAAWWWGVREYCRIVNRRNER